MGGTPLARKCSNSAPPDCSAERPTRKARIADDALRPLRSTGVLMEPRVRVLVADDEAAVRRGLRMQLQIESDIEVVGEAWDRDSAVALTGSLKPDVVVLDVRMPRANEGIEAAAILRDRHPGARVVVLTMHDDPRIRQSSEEAGAVCLVAKSEPCERLVEAIRRAAGRAPESA